MPRWSENKAEPCEEEEEEEEEGAAEEGFPPLRADPVADVQVLNGSRQIKVRGDDTHGEHDCRVRQKSPNNYR
ncbi:hypothetical protein EYF80_004450 [Liparis tanakae]|uniref:Uncharacterized protein n=1 Tax=Liparis tanakae TaxID=230148 RepID=A0A4Z2J6X9_9TELE|nr:hypothetical protein EYF80_004450 [Liparis tanakae]